MDEETKTKANSYLTYKIGEEEFASHVNQVLNILELSDITKVPKAPNYMKGVINLRGMVLPVIDTRLKFGMSETVFTEKTCIIVMELTLDEKDDVYLGALVDEVVAVIELEKDQIEPPPGIGSKYKSDFIFGMAKHDEKFIMMLDMEKVFSMDEIAELKNKSEQKELV